MPISLVTVRVLQCIGFSTAPADALYLPVDPAADAPNVEAEEADPESLLNRTRRLIALRHAEPALANYAEFVPLFAEPNTYPFVYARAAGKDVVLVMFNPRAEAAEATFPVDVNFRRTQLLAGDKFPIRHDAKARTVTISMPGTSYAIVKLK